MGEREKQERSQSLWGHGTKLEIEKKRGGGEAIRKSRKYGRRGSR